MIKTKRMHETAVAIKKAAVDAGKNPASYMMGSLVMAACVSMFIACVGITLTAVAKIAQIIL